MKELKIAKVHTPSGNYAYQLSNQAAVNVNEINIDLSHFGFVSIEFSGTLAVIKTRPGFAMALAGEIDKRAGKTILGTVAGDDTILIIPKETFSRSEILNSLSEFIPNIK